MKKYPEDQSEIDWSKFPFTKFKIVVPSENDRDEIMQACKHLHDCRNVNTNFVTVNQIVHLYEDERNPNPIIVLDKDLYDSLNIDK